MTAWQHTGAKLLGSAKAHGPTETEPHFGPLRSGACLSNFWRVCDIQGMDIHAIKMLRQGYAIQLLTLLRLSSIPIEYPMYTHNSDKFL